MRATLSILGAFTQSVFHGISWNMMGLVITKYRVVNQTIYYRVDKGWPSVLTHAPVSSIR